MIKPLFVKKTDFPLILAFKANSAKCKFSNVFCRQNHIQHSGESKGGTGEPSCNFGLASYILISLFLLKKMEYQPPEIVDIIFKQFLSLKDLIKCFETCLKWRKFIGETFKDQRKK